MPRFAPLGPLVTTIGHVISGAGSPGQQVWMGNLARSISSPRSMISWQGALDTVFGFIAKTDLTIGNRASASRHPLGGSGWRKKASCSPKLRSSSGVRCIPAATRATVPNRLVRTGIEYVVPLGATGFSNSTAGPRSASKRVCISVISSAVLTGSEMRTSWPSRSRQSIKSLRLEYAMGDQSLLIQ